MILHSLTMGTVVLLVSMLVSALGSSMYRVPLRIVALTLVSETCEQQSMQWVREIVCVS